MSDVLTKSDQAIVKLLEGNRRYASGLRSIETFISGMRLRNLAEQGQKPFCIVLTCSDSRAPTETLFDRGLGDMFVLRVAGNTLSNAFLAGIEYAALHFDVSLCLVMGHTQCGAIAATVKRHFTPNPALLPSPHLERLTFEISQAAQGQAKINEEALTLSNIRKNVERIQSQSKLIQRKVNSEQMRVVGALYNLETGVVDFDLAESELNRFNHLVRKI